jgi:hypothetical protein
MINVEIYEPPIGCRIGNCGPDAEDELERFNAALESIEALGVAVVRYNLGLEPEAFSENEKVKATVKEKGIACLPLVLGNGRVVSEGRYPAADELTEAVRALTAAS